MAMTADVLEQPVLGSRRLSNFLVAAAVSIGGVGFLLASLSSYLGRDLLPLGHPSALIFVPQGLVMGLYSIAAALLASYLWYVIAVNVGGGSNRFDKEAGVVTISRRGFRKPVNVEIPIKDVKAVKAGSGAGASGERDEDDEEEMEGMVMTRKDRKLYEAIQKSKTTKRERAAKLTERRKKIKTRK